MEFDFIPQFIIVFSSGIIIFILGKNISKIKNIPDDDFLVESGEEKAEKEKFIFLYKRLLKRVSKEEYQKRADLFWIWLEKTLRKIRINFLKMDNKMVALLEKLREKKVENIEKKIAENYANAGQDTSIAGPEAGQKDANINNNENFDLPADENNNGNRADDKNSMEKKDKKISVAVHETKKTTVQEQECLNLILENPSNIKAYWKLGIIYSRRKNYKDAISCFSQIVKIDPGYGKAKKKIMELMDRMSGKKSDATKGTGDEKKQA